MARIHLFATFCIMSEERIIASLETELKKAMKKVERIKASIAPLKGKAPRQRHVKRLKKRRTKALRAGRLPALASDFLKDTEKPVTLAEMADAIGKRHGKDVTVRQLSVALARFVREEKFFRVTDDGKYELIKA